MQNGLKLTEELKGVSDGHHSLETLCDVLLQLGFNVGDIYIEGDEISIELVLSEIKKTMVHSLEAGNVLVERINDGVDILKFVHTQSSELLNGTEELNELSDTSTEQVKSTKDLVWREFELLTFWHVHQSFFGEVILLLICGIEINAGLEDWNEFIWWISIVVPKGIILRRSSLLWSLTLSGSGEVKNGLLASLDHA